MVSVGNMAAYYLSANPNSGYLVAVQPWASHVTSLSLSSSACKMGIRSNLELGETTFVKCLVHG